jgi:heat shock protein HslJ
MMARFRLVGVVAVVALSFGCADSATAPSAVESLEGTWSLVAWESSSGSVESVPEADAYTAAFTREGRINLRADCNRCFGSFTTSSGLRMSVGNLGCTRAACPEGSKSSAYVEAVSGASAYQRHGSQLFIYYPDGRLRFLQN